MAKQQQETLINERDISGIIESGKDTSAINDQLTKYDGDNNKES